MSKLPILSGKKCVQVLQNNGFELRRQKGSHIILRHSYTKTIVTVPNHKALDRGTLRAIIRQSGLDLKLFL